MIARLRPRRICLLAFAIILAAAPVTGHVEPQAGVRYEHNAHIFRPVHARNGMVVTEQGLATQIGVDILHKGGNAVDATVAVGFALAVVLPQAGNIGGGGFMLIHEAKTGRNIALDFRETAPAEAARDMFLDAHGEPVSDLSLHTHMSSGVPGTVAGLAVAAEKHGTLPLKALLQPAIHLARAGFIVSEELAFLLNWQSEVLGRWESTRAIFFRDGQPLRAGERLVQKDLAHSLELIARDGPRAFYRGEIARRIAAEMARHGGLVNADDLAAYKAVEREPVTGSYRGYTIVSMPPPSSGGVHLVQMLNLLERYPLRDYGANSAQTIHLMSEAMKLAYADRAAYLGDTDFTTVPVRGLISRAYADTLAARIDPAQATPSERIKPGTPQPYESDQTTHYSIADRHGNVVATTYTLNLIFGSGIVAQGTGILLNNEMDDFSSKPGAPNAFKLTGGDANAIAPRKRPLSSMAPTIVLKDGRPWLVTGSSGGSRIITTVLQTVIDSIDFDMNPAEAAAQPRVHQQWMPDQLRVEPGLSADTLSLLAQKGQRLSVGPTMGRAETIRIGEDGYSGWSDPRSPDGAAIGY